MTPTPAFSAAIEQLKASLKQLPPRGKIEGCSEEDIRVIENAYKVTLPQAYKEFLLTMGRNCPYIFDEEHVGKPRTGFSDLAVVPDRHLGKGPGIPGLS